MICFLATQGLVNRGPCDKEAMYNLDEDINHGNFLDVVTVLAKYNKNPE